MKNRRGQTMNERLTEEFEYLKTVEDYAHKKALAYKALGAADMAIEFGLITYTEWEKFVEDFFQLE